MVELKNPTYYKYKVTDKKDENIKYFFTYKELNDYIKVPRTTLYRILKGHNSKYLKEHNFYSVKLPRLELREIAYSTD
tara:strand:- start:415 stop:648 length:234 start_codon:yes stop_codon:yes gene_type:complete